MARSLAASLAVAAALFSILTQADVTFSSPAAGQVISGSTIDVEFAEGTGSPSLADFTTYTLQLCAGGSGASDFIPLVTFTDKGDFSKTTYTASIADLAVGGNTKNAYFLRTIGVAPGGTVINYSSRFTLSDMTGQFSTAITQGLAKVSGTAGPATQNNIANPQNAGAQTPAAGAGSFTIPYTMQTGPFKYAPMALRAPSQITAKGNARQYPTSAYSVWLRSGMPGPVATQTVTDAFTYSVSSMEPTIAAQSQPNDMEKFLNRWKD